MPLKIAAVLQRSKDHPENINVDIYDFHEIFTRGNRYVALHLDEEGEYACERNLIDYVKDMGFEGDAIILVDKEWDVEPAPVAVPGWAAPPVEFPPIRLNRPIRPGEVIFMDEPVLAVRPMQPDEAAW